MDENLIKLKHLRQAATEANGRISDVAETAAEAIEEVSNAKQDKLSGEPGQVVGFDADGNAIPQAAPSGGGTGDTFLVKAPVGCIMAWTDSDNIPIGWHICNGEDGTWDLRGQFLYGADENHEVGSTGGEEEHTLTKAELPEHNHNLRTNSASGLDTWINTKTWRLNLVPANSGIDSYTGSLMRLPGDALGGYAHNNMPPYTTIIWIQKIAPDESDCVTIDQVNEAIDTAIGDINAILDAINGEVV